LENKLPANIEDYIRQIENIEDYELASQALMEVVRLEPATGARLALNILRSKAGDKHLRAFSFSMLYRANRAAAFEYTREYSNTCDAEVFVAILGEVAEDVGVLNDSTDLQQVVSHLRFAISNRPDRDADAMKRGINDFLRVYGDLNPPM
jgi:hypothetical protein